MKRNNTIIYQVLCLVLLAVICVMSVKSVKRSRVSEDAPNGKAQASKTAGNGEWRSVPAAELSENPFTLFSDDWMVLACGVEGDVNAMTIGWGGLGILWGRDTPVVTVYVEKSRYTHDFMSRYDTFTLTAFPDDYRAALQYLGNHSGRDGDKIAESGLTLGFSELGNPVFKEARLVLECKKIYEDDFDPDGFGELGRSIYSTGRQLHTVYIGEIVDVRIK